MRFHLKNIAFLGLFMILATVSIQAQSRGEVSIPFDFYAGSKKMKAGAYVVKPMTGNMLAIRKADGKVTALVNAPLTIGERDSKAGQRLVFNKYGDQFFLSQVWLRVDTGRQLFPSKEETKAAREYDLAHQTAKPERRDIAIR